MTAKIAQRINPVSRRWQIGDHLAAVLLVELENQRLLAEQEYADPSPYDIRVFRERSSPWGEFRHREPGGLRPIVNIWFDNENHNQSASNAVSRQKVESIFQIDCYAAAVSRATECGHEPADLMASRVADQTVEVVRSILMGGPYMYLGLPRREQQFVWSRYIQSITMFQPPLENAHVNSIHAGRISFGVDFNENSPETQGEPVEIVDVRVKRLSTGEFLLGARFEDADS